MAVVVVTGCSSGIGMHTALAFARRGDRVHATVRNAGRAGRLRDALARESLAATIVPLEVTDGDAVRAVIAKVLAQDQRIDVLVNNAGIGGPAAALEEIDEAVARAVWETNFWAPFRLSRAVLPGMRAQASGVIVNLSTFGTASPAGQGSPRMR
jgi:NAD(P)-dependent dehydrogenase (short-subunit alcohol dehydrogenase family)